MSKLGVNKETAEELGYIRVFNFRDNKYLLDKNQAVVEFSLAVLKYNKKEIYKYKSALLCNFMFIVRVIIYHVILVSLSNAPLTATFTMLFVELLYMIYNINLFIYIKPLLFQQMFISKIIQSIFLNIFHLMTLFIVFKYKSSEPPIFVQYIAMYSLIISITFEYMFLVVDIYYTIQLICKERIA